MGGNQGEQPVLGKEGRWPLDIVPAASAALPAPTMAENTAQAPPHPAVAVGENKGTAMLEILKPAGQGTVPVREDGRQPVSVRAPGLRTNRFLQLIHALSPGPTFS